MPNENESLNLRLEAIREKAELTLYTDDERRVVLANIRDRQVELQALELKIKHEKLEMQALEAIHRLALGQTQNDPRD